MLCPRCNSENELGEKFCRFCGAPLIDTELFLDPKEQKRREKILKITNENYTKKQNAQKYIDKMKKNSIMNLTNSNL